MQELIFLFEWRFGSFCFPNPNTQMLLQWMRSPGKKGSHFDPNCDLFNPKERKEVMISTLCWAVAVATLVGLAFVLGPLLMFKLYVVPYWVFYKLYLYHLIILLF